VIVDYFIFRRFAMRNKTLSVMTTSAALTVLLLFGVLYQAAALDLVPDGTSSDSRGYESVPVIIETDGQEREYTYDELTDAEKFLVQLSLARLNDHLRTTHGHVDPVGDILSGRETTVASFGCGFESTNSEPFQFGCWLGGSVCYVSVGDDGADFGCHECNGTNCPTD
jgi:hypothetical protein